jgi:hypothetical protein
MISGVHIYCYQQFVKRHRIWRRRDAKITFSMPYVMDLLLLRLTIMAKEPSWHNFTHWSTKHHRGKNQKTSSKADKNSLVMQQKTSPNKLSSINNKKHWRDEKFSWKIVVFFFQVQFSALAQNILCSFVTYLCTKNRDIKNKVCLF